MCDEIVIDPNEILDVSHNYVMSDQHGKCVSHFSCGNHNGHTKDYTNNYSPENQNGLFYNTNVYNSPNSFDKFVSQDEYAGIIRYKAEPEDFFNNQQYSDVATNNFINSQYTQSRENEPNINDFKSQASTSSIQYSFLPSQSPLQFQRSSSPSQIPSNITTFKYDPQQDMSSYVVPVVEYIPVQNEFSVPTNNSLPNQNQSSTSQTIQTPGTSSQAIQPENVLVFSEQPSSSSLQNYNVLPQSTSSTNSQSNG
ncbi:MAG: hypothetical protein ACRCZW_14935, partial [Lactobacillaceae bacterium]